MHKPGQITWGVEYGLENDIPVDEYTALLSLQFQSRSRLQKQSSCKTWTIIMMEISVGLVRSH